MMVCSAIRAVIGIITDHCFGTYAVLKDKFVDI